MARLLDMFLSNDCILDHVLFFRLFNAQEQEASHAIFGSVVLSLKAVLKLKVHHLLITLITRVSNRKDFDATGVRWDILGSVVLITAALSDTN